jgi:GntR family transcriptional regulator, rspAB operon transcriptional repressor
MILVRRACPGAALFNAGSLRATSYTNISAPARGLRGDGVDAGQAIANGRAGSRRPPRHPPARASVASTIYARLRDELVSMVRRPGEPIVEKEIAAAHGVSRTPVREAVLRLADERLIDIFPQSGTFVSRIPLAALPEAMVIRRTLEETSARLAAERGTPAQLAVIDAVLRRQREVSARGDQDAFHHADEAFHAAIADAAGLPTLWTLVQQVKVQVDRVRRLTLPQKGRMPLLIREHAAVAAAIKKRDPDAAAARMGHHLDRLLRELEDLRHLNPDFFIPAEPPLPQAAE